MSMGLALTLLRYVNRLGAYLAEGADLAAVADGLGGVLEADAAGEQVPRARVGRDQERHLRRDKEVSDSKNHCECDQYTALI